MAQKAPTNLKSMRTIITWLTAFGWMFAIAAFLLVGSARPNTPNIITRLLNIDVYGVSGFFVAI